MEKEDRIAGRAEETRHTLDRSVTLEDSQRLNVYLPIKRGNGEKSGMTKTYHLRARR